VLPRVPVADREQGVIRDTTVSPGGMRDVHGLVSIELSICLGHMASEIEPIRNHFLY
jgi:hypothetical protein